ncbi:MAG: PKD domain-containing protein [Candidatus Thermoplasmatota archaeon]|nr:PKD domain-containing protein [Candidatus Thermoplasmatota archaeon]
MHRESDTVPHRRLTIAVVVMAAVLLGAPYSMLLKQEEPAHEGRSGVLATEERPLRIGCAGYEMSTLNPLKAVYSSEMVVLWSCYSTLLTRDAEGVLRGDLVTHFESSPDSLVWTIEIVETASFYNKYDPEANHPLTVDDIIFTYWLVQNTTNNLQNLLPEIPEAGGGLVLSMHKITDFRMSLTLRTEYAPFLSALTSIPILPKYIWEGRPWNWVNHDSSSKIAPCVGSGTWYYAQDALPTAGIVELRRNDRWFAIEEYGWKPRPTSLVLLFQSSPESNLEAYSTGQTDIMLGGTRAQFSAGVPGQTWGSSQGLVYEFNMNQMSTAMRSQLVHSGLTRFEYGTNSQLLLDPIVKLALCMCVDKDAFVEEVLDGWGADADSLVPPVSEWHYSYGSGPGETPIVFDTSAARSLLWTNGWKYDSAGNEVPESGTQCPLYGYVDGVLTPLEFRFYTLSTSTEWIVGAILMKEWAEQVGVLLNLVLKNLGQMNTIWWAADYDVWLWDWLFTPYSDPSTDIMSLLTTGEIGNWSDVFWSNATYDALYNDSVCEINAVSRGLILAEMQRMAYLHSGCWPVAYADTLYAAQSVAPANWQNYGNWTEDFPLTPDSGYPWLFLQIYPADNPPPVISELVAFHEVDINDPLDLTAWATDDSELEYLWNFGDGTKSGWLTSPNTTHTYTADGWYTAYFAAKEVSSTNDSHISWETTNVRVIDGCNKAPKNLSITYVPGSPDPGDIITFTGSATDPEGDTLYFSWSFGDGFAASGDIVMHKYAAPGNYTVTMYVTDNHIGTEPRPSVATLSIPVSENRPPILDVPETQLANWKDPWIFIVNASDSDGDPLLLTWFWGDGTFDVTDTTWATHLYYSKGCYSLTVCADDLTGLSGHNVSDTGTVAVMDLGMSYPTVDTWAVSKTNPCSGEQVTFTAAARDKNMDYLTLTLDFGDGTKAVRKGTPPGVNTPVTFLVNKTYEAGGTYTAHLYVYDGGVNVTSSGIVMEVVQNDAPFLWTPLADTTAVKDVAKTIDIDPFDIDSDPLKFTWEWGDGEITVTTSTSVSHTYTVADEYVYRVYIDDAHGHNVSYAAIMHVQLSFALDLVAGWNLVTVPLTGHSYRASTLPLNMGDAVIRYNTSWGIYDKTFVVGISPSSMDFDIFEGEGYWVYSTSSKTIHLQGDCPTGTKTVKIDVPTGGGWALIGLTSLKTWHASDIYDMLTSGSISVLYGFDPVSKTYEMFIPGLPFTDFLIPSGRAFWVYCSSGTELTYEA